MTLLLKIIEPVINGIVSITNFKQRKPIGAGLPAAGR